jgi:TPR repeat protein
MSAEQFYLPQNFNAKFDYACSLIENNNAPQAYQILHKNAQLNHIPSIRKIASSYLNGYYFKQDLEEAKKYYHKAANLGDTNSLTRVADIILKTKKSNSDIRIALNMYDGAATNKDKEARLALSKIFLHGLYNRPKDTTTARNMLKELVYENFIPSYLLYGYCCMNGLGGDVDLKEAYQFLKKAVIFNLQQANEYLYQILYKGIDQTDDHSVIRKLHIKIAENHVDAQYDLGKILESEDNHIEAKKWFEIAADNGHIGALYKLGMVQYPSEFIIDVYGESMSDHS